MVRCSYMLIFVCVYTYIYISLPVVRLLASVPIIVTSYTFIKRVRLHRDLSYLIHSDKGYQFNNYVQI